MNSKAIVLLLAIVSVGGMGITSQAFADQETPYRYLDNIDPNQTQPSITFHMESDTYDHNSIIVITGQVKTVKEVDVVFVISGPMGIVQVDQVKVSSDGSLVGVGSSWRWLRFGVGLAWRWRWLGAGLALALAWLWH